MQQSLTDNDAMKTAALTFAMAVALGFTALAGEQAKDNAKTAKPAPAEKAKKSEAVVPQTEKDVALTGSYIKRDVRRNGMVTDGPSPLYVVDNETIRNTGASTLRDLLVRKGLNR